MSLLLRISLCAHTPSSRPWRYCPPPLSAGSFFEAARRRRPPPHSPRLPMSRARNFSRVSPPTANRSLTRAGLLDMRTSTCSAWGAGTRSISLGKPAWTAGLPRFPRMERKSHSRLLQSIAPRALRQRAPGPHPGQGFLSWARPENRCAESANSAIDVGA